MRDMNLYGIGGLYNYLGTEDFKLILDSVNSKYNNAIWRKYATWGQPTNDRDWKQGVKKTPILVRASVLGTHSEKPQRSTEGWKLYAGTLPKIGHGFNITQDDLLELRRLSKINDQAFGEVLLDSFIQNSSNMLGGIHNELSYMTLQAMSTGRIYDVAVDGYTYDFDFQIPNENFLRPTANWFDATGAPNASADVVQDLLDFQDYYTNTLSLGVDHWKMSRELFDKVLKHPKVIAAYKASKNYYAPTNADIKVARTDVLTWLHQDMGIWPFDVIDFKSRHEEDGKPVADAPAFDKHNIAAASSAYRPFEMKCMNSIYADRVKLGGLNPSDLYSFVEGRIAVLNSWQERPIMNIVDCELYAGPVFNNLNEYGIVTVWDETASSSSGTSSSASS